MDPKDLCAKITPKLCAIIPVHLYGRMAHMDAICKIASENNIKITEDAAQALGSKLNDRYAGTISDAGCFSLYLGKIITSSKGGLLVTNDDHTYDMALNVRNHDMIKGYDTETFGLCLRMTEIVAAMAKIQFDRLDNFILERSKNARFLNKLLENTNSSTLVLRK